MKLANVAFALGLSTAALAGAESALATSCIFVGAREAIDAKRSEHVFLGEPQTAHFMTPNRKGCFRHYAGGSVYWSIDHGAFEVHGDVRRLWAAHGWETGHLGFPVTDAWTTPDGVGRFNHFERGSIYWKASLGAHMIVNGFRAYWAARGWETYEALGYPISSELQAFPVAEDRYQDFENGVLYYRHATGEIHEIWPFPLASRTKDEIEDQIADTVDAMLAGAGAEAYRDGGVSIAAVEDYALSPTGGVQNRTLVVKVRVKYVASFLGIDGALPDPYSDVTLKVRLSGRRRFSGDAVILNVVTGWAATTTVPYPTRLAISPATVNARLAGELDPLVGRESEMGVLPHPLSLLSAKVTREGGLSVYVAPLD